MQIKVVSRLFLLKPSLVVSQPSLLSWCCSSCSALPPPNCWCAIDCSPANMHPFEWPCLCTWLKDLCHKHPFSKVIPSKLSSPARQNNLQSRPIDCYSAAGHPLLWFPLNSKQGHLLLHLIVTLLLLPNPSNCSSDALCYHALWTKARDVWVTLTFQSCLFNPL